MGTKNQDNNQDMPWLIDVNVFMTPKSEIGFGPSATDAAYVNNGRNGSSGTQNDEIAWDVVLGAGTWTVELILALESSQGITSVQIDGVGEGTIDGYAASFSAVNARSVSGITVAESGVHELKLKMATKNASSSGYALTFSHVQLRRTA